MGWESSEIYTEDWMIINKREFIDYSMLTLFVANSGFSYFHGPIVSIPLFAFLLTFFILRKRTLNITFLFFIVVLFAITLLQALKFQFFPIVTGVGLLIMVTNAYLIVKNLEDKFIPYYINLLYYLAIISLVIYFSMLIIPPIKVLYSHITPIFHLFNFSGSGHKSILVYNFGTNPLGAHFRNSGPFWEAGAFAGYLIIAYMFHFLKVQEITNKKNMVFLIAIVTTLSTTAFLALFIFFFFFYFKKIKNFLFKVSSVIIIIMIGIFAYNTLDFLGEKIESQWQMAQEKGIHKSNNSQRFLNILRDINSLKGHEFVGRGGNNKTRFDLDPEGGFVIPTVGLTDVMVKYGIPFFILILFFLYRSVCLYLKQLNHQNLLYCLGIILAILTTLVSEVYFAFSMYWSLLFMQFVYRGNEEGKRT